MSDKINEFGKTAEGLAKNPLGIIALFIVLVYAFASLVTAFSASFTPNERLPLIYFLVCFPVLVLGVFAWLVSRHAGKLYAPSDYKNEDNYVKMQLSAVASLAVATARRPGQDVAPEETTLERVVEAVRGATPNKASDSKSWRTRILWVDDRPENNTYERRAFEAVGLSFTLATSTQEALEMLKNENFAAIISDMGRREGPREGYALLEAVRNSNYNTPFFIYAGSNRPEHKKEAVEHGAQGSTNDAQELFSLVTSAIIAGNNQ